MSQFGLQEYTENILGLPDNISKLIKSHRGLSDFDK